jgi:hypothetical protein
MNDEIRDYLKVLNDLSYVNECLSQDFTGEAKRELSALVENLKSDTALLDRDSLVERLDNGYQYLIDYKKREASAILCVVSRELWMKVL